MLPTRYRGERRGGENRRLRLTRMAVYSGLQVDALVGLDTAVAFYMGGSRLAHGSAVGTLRHGAALFVDVLERPV